MRDALATAVRAKYPPEKIMALVEEELESEDNKTRCWAKQWLGDRGYGNAKEVVEHHDEPELTPDELVEELRIMAREYIDSLPPDERADLLNPVPTDTIQ